jgi:predicted peroxiredoxin
MADNGKAVINLATGHEDADKVTVAFLVATAALTKGKEVAMVLTKEAERLGLPGYADAIESAGAPPVQRLFEQYRDGGGELLVCPICFQARNLDEPALVSNARLAGATRCGTGSETARRSSATEKRRSCSASDGELLQPSRLRSVLQPALRPPGSQALPQARPRQDRAPDGRLPRVAAAPSGSTALFVTLPARRSTGRAG